MKKHYFFLLFAIVLLGSTDFANSQEVSNQEIKEKIEAYKKLHRGPYLKIEWFCEDGTRRDSKDPCPDDIEGIQHASYKPFVKTLREKNHLFFADILAYSKKNAFWDAANLHSRLKQYQLNKYLASIDNGWILEKAQYYRGSVQSEDEEEWGEDFYNWLFLNDKNLEENYFLIRQSLKDIPHGNNESNEAETVRSLSKIIADNNEDFMDVRTKIHGSPAASDIELVDNFRENHSKQLSEKQVKQLDSLHQALTSFYAPVTATYFKNKLRYFPKNSFLRKKLNEFSNQNLEELSSAELVQDAANLMCEIRTSLESIPSTSDKLEALDISLQLEEIIFKNSHKWKPENLLELLDKIYNLSLATAASGYVEWWEWNQVEPHLQVENLQNISLKNLQNFLVNSQAMVEWGSAMVKTVYGPVVEHYKPFEPKATSFIDDRIRSSLVLQLSNSLEKMGQLVKKEANLKNRVFNLENQVNIRGLNPGFAKGKLIIVKDNPKKVDVKQNNIYIFQKAPADLEPVAGIATVAEGNLVSHVQLLARNLGIPNAVISEENLKEIEKYKNQEIFYAVSDKGNVVMKPATELSEKEKELFSQEKQTQERIKVPLTNLDLSVKKPVSLREISAKHSGKICGPKAANLGELKNMFPKKVVNGLVLPFGVFQAHMEQKMPNYSGSYWHYLSATFEEAEELRAHNFTKEEIKTCQLERLAVLRNAIENMAFLPNFTNALEKSFQNNFNSSIGQTPVFLRSDTNMEDLENFTGAGLNLTVFNVRDKNKVLQGIKDVWASPYTARSFKWRQSFLENPENVYPSILIIPSVDVDYSGVLITKDLENNQSNGLTLAFSKGAGGAVDGQSAESWTVQYPQGIQLLAPAREFLYNQLPEHGGLVQKHTYLNRPILSQKNIDQIRELATTIREKIPKSKKASSGPYDVELGFKDDNLWLFQIRPFVENEKAKSSNYLAAMNPPVDYTKKIDLNQKI
ncbi:PEP/pyruvate-binding domain-containing protein [Haloflavibacter putidus]|uniref:Phosphoenolpyruvate synthase n=1 Tax=Haloflavibacter putidus TaxID=2576776 RepID=A0A507ZT68_9FLAO|nr:PEP/pyruvate-binding domain-containing protein [Haloflavibacter putidus]TQD39444.1 phosphoenolpyruvate synthase [Haloflavibacter putidus]